MEGTGSVLNPKVANREEVYGRYKELRFSLEKKNSEGKDPGPENPLKELKLRFFSPKEVANLMCFPAKFQFPADMSIRQCYKLLGNSLNVLVVAELLRCLIGNDLE